MQAEHQLGSQSPKAEDAQQQGGSQGTIQAMADVVTQRCGDGRHQAGAQIDHGRYTGALQGDESRWFMAIQLVCQNPGQKCRIGKNNGQHGHPAVQAEQLKQQQPPDQFMD